MINASFYYSKGGISLIIIEAERVLDALCCLKELKKFMAKLNFQSEKFLDILILLYFLLLLLFIRS